MLRTDGNFAAWADFKAWMDVAFARALRNPSARFVELLLKAHADANTEFVIRMQAPLFTMTALVLTFTLVEAERNFRQVDSDLTAEASQLNQIDRLLTRYDTPAATILRTAMSWASTEAPPEASVTMYTSYPSPRACTAVIAKQISVHSAATTSCPRPLLRTASTNRSSCQLLIRDRSIGVCSGNTSWTLCSNRPPRSLSTVLNSVGTPNSLPALASPTTLFMIIVGSWLFMLAN